MMAALHGRLKYVDDKSRDIVKGYKHDSEQNLKISIPEAILNIVLLFYFQFVEKFKDSTIGIRISGDGKTASKIRGVGNWKTAFGSIIIDCALYNNSICIWELKVHANKEEDREYFTFGIADDEHITEATLEEYQYFFDNDFCKNYALSVNTPNSMCDLECWEDEDRNAICIYGGNTYPYPQILQKSAENNLKLEFNIKERTIKFYGNGQKYEQGFRNVDVTRKYRFGIALVTGDTTMEIRDFCIKNAP